MEYLNINRWASFCLRNRTIFIILLINNILSISCVPIIYTELESVNKTCAPKDTCLGGRGNRLGLSLDWKARNCFCDNLCKDYGDCCLNANAFDAEEQETSKINFQCVQLRNYEGVYMKTQCPATWTDTKIADQCKLAAAESAINDPMLYIPVTSRYSRITYSNYFCSICNNDSTNVELWKSRLECPSLNEQKSILNKTFITENLIFKDGNWGLTLTLDDVEIFHRCSIDPFIPETVIDMIRPCLNATNTCSQDWTDDDVRQKCDSYTAVIYENEKPFRNFHCAQCNYARQKFLYCDKRTFSRFNFRNDFNPIAFSLLFDFTDNNGGNVVGLTSSCGSTEIWDPFFKKCRNVVCGVIGSEYRHGRCINDEPTTSIPSSTTTIEIQTTTVKIDDKSEYIEIHFPTEETKDNTSIDSNENVISVAVEKILINKTLNGSVDIINNGKEVNIEKEKKPHSLNCNRILLPEEEFTKGPNGTIIVEKYSRTYLAKEYEIHEGGILVCTVLLEAEKFSSIMGYVTIIGLSISSVCIIIHLIAFMYVPELRNLSGKNLVSLCLSLLCAYACFILSIFGEAGKLECVILASLMYYFFLASFCWMNVMAFDIWYTLRLATSELRVSAGRQWRKFICYSIYGWLLPGAALFTLLVLDIARPDTIPEHFLPELGQRWCWFGQRKALLVFFAAPLTVIMTVNIMMFIMAARIIAATTHSTSKMSTSAPHQNQFKLYMRLALLMGLTWISGIIAGYLQLEFIWYAFVLMNTLQGLFIFISFTCTKKVFRTVGGSCWRKIKVARHTSTTWAARSSSSKKGLDSQDSNQSHLSHSSMAHLTTNTSRSNVDTF